MFLNYGCFGLLSGLYFIACWFCCLWLNRFLEVFVLVLWCFYPLIGQYVTFNPLYYAFHRINILFYVFIMFISFKFCIFT